jgi:hypothetical protein
MFFIGIFGVQDKDRLIREYDSIICPGCGRLSRAELVELYTYFHFFFIPLFKWNRRYFIRFRCCGSIYAVEGNYVQELKKGATLDTGRLEKIGASGNTCPGCGNYVNPGFNYCPYCGAKLS